MNLRIWAACRFCDGQHVIDSYDLGFGRDKAVCANCVEKLEAQFPSKIAKQILLGNLPAPPGLFRQKEKP